MESRDILNYALALSAIVFTFFMCWLLWYFIKIVRSVERVVRDITTAVEKLNTVLDFAKEKIGAASAVVPLIIKGVEQLMGFAQNWREQRSSRSQKNSSRKSKEE